MSVTKIIRRRDFLALSAAAGAAGLANLAPDARAQAEPTDAKDRCSQSPGPGVRPSGPRTDWRARWTG